MCIVVRTTTQLAATVAAERHRAAGRRTTRPIPYYGGWAFAVMTRKPAAAL